jgi:hypothetical protein
MADFVYRVTRAFGAFGRGQELTDAEFKSVHPENHSKLVRVAAPSPAPGAETGEGAKPAAEVPAETHEG